MKTFIKATGRRVVTILATAIVAVPAGCDKRPSLPQASRQSDRKNEEQWLSRARGYFDALHATDRNGPIAILSVVYVAVGDWQRAGELINEIEDRQQRRNQQVSLAMAITREAGIASAVAYAETLDKRQTKFEDSDDLQPSDRDCALVSVVRMQASAHDFQGAVRTLGLVNNPVTASWGWQVIARRQAEAGLYDDADRSLSRATPVLESERRVQDELQSDIAKCRSSGRKDAAQEFPKGLLDGMRQMAGLFDGVLGQCRSGAEAEQKADQLTSPGSKAVAWRQVAWAYYGDGDSSQTRRAIAQSLANTPAINLPYQKALNYVLLADLCAELGDIDQGRRLVRECEAIRDLRDPLCGLHRFTILPVVISVLVRVGTPEDAVRLLDAVCEEDAETAWAVFAGTCALTGRLDFVEQELNTLKSDRLRAILCSGVVLGLVDKRESHPAGLSSGIK